MPQKQALHCKVEAHSWSCEEKLQICRLKWAERWYSKLLYTKNPFYFNILLPFSFLLQKPILLPHFFAQQLLIQLSIILLLVTFDSEHLCNISLITLQLYLLRAPQAVCREKKKRFHNFNIWKYSLHNLTPQSCMSRLPWKQWIWQVAILQV